MILLQSLLYIYEKLNTMNNCIVPFIDKEFPIKRESIPN